MTQIDTTTETSALLRWRLPALPALFERASRTRTPTENTPDPDRFETSRDGADRLALRSGSLSGNW